MDQMVLETQKWLNKTYQGRMPSLTEDGITGWSTIQALTRALQLELGLTSDGLWGPSTEEKCPTISSNSGNKNIITILQCGLFCKGYDGGGIDGNFTTRTSAGISNLKKDAGLSDTNGNATPLIFKVLLSTMDGFVLAISGDPNVRKIQQNLNRDYYKTIGLIPCNGVYSRDTNRALIKALQVEEGTTPDGIWGPGTQDKCPTIPGSNSNQRYVLLLQYSLYVNGIDPNGFDGLF
ncbi:peptidoglycan-binding domain-containing protein [Clostridium botulinum]